MRIFELLGLFVLIALMGIVILFVLLYDFVFDLPQKLWWQDRGFSGKR